MRTRTFILIIENQHYSRIHRTHDRALVLESFSVNSGFSGHHTEWEVRDSFYRSLNSLRKKLENSIKMQKYVLNDKLVKKKKNNF